MPFRGGAPTLLPRIGGARADVCRAMATPVRQRVAEIRPSDARIPIRSRRRADAPAAVQPASATLPPGLRIGTSGWTYGDWRGPFYPPTLPKKDWLGWYARQFGSTEINGSFYRTPSLEAVRAWHDTTPDSFVFAWKASKFITHWKRLLPSAANSLALMATRLEILGAKAGPVLFQLPPNFVADAARLAGFLAMLPPAYRFVFEFRHQSWYAPDILALLRRHEVALCLSDHRDAPAPWEVTAPHVYVRGHGPTGAYKDSYSDRVLRDWARRIRAWRREGREVFVYFDNDQKSCAPRDAERLSALL
jgi:uncharacterized protein YecE (DUF72 family)